MNVNDFINGSGMAIGTPCVLARILNEMDSVNREQAEIALYGTDDIPREVYGAQVARGINRWAKENMDKPIQMDSHSPSRHRREGCKTCGR